MKHREHLMKSIAVFSLLLCTLAAVRAAEPAEERVLHVGDAQTAAILPTAAAIAGSTTAVTFVEVPDLAETGQVLEAAANGRQYDLLALQLFGHRTGTSVEDETAQAEALIASFLEAHPEARVRLLQPPTDGSRHFDEVTRSWDGHAWVDNCSRAQRAHHREVAAALRERFGAETINEVPIAGASAALHDEIMARGEESPIYHISDLLAQGGMSARPSRTGIYLGALVWLAATSPEALADAPRTEGIEIEAEHLQPSKAPAGVDEEQAAMLRDVARRATR